MQPAVLVGLPHLKVTCTIPSCICTMLKYVCAKFTSANCKNKNRFNDPTSPWKLVINKLNAIYMSYVIKIVSNKMH